VWKSTGFGPYREPSVDLPAGLEPLAREGRAFYDEMYDRRLTP
jgi:hypothetical protein